MVEGGALVAMDADLAAASILDLGDVEPNSLPAGARYALGGAQFPGNGFWYIQGSRMSWGATDADSADRTSQITAASGSIFWSTDGSNWTEIFFTGSVQGPVADSYYIDITSGTLPTLSGDLYLSFSTPGTPSPAPLVDGDYLRYDGTDFRPQQLATVAETGAYSDLSGTPATATLDTVTTAGATTNNDISVGDLLTVQGDGASQDGRLKLNCSANTHAVTIQSPPRSDAATYSLILPSSAGSAGQVLTSQAGAQLTWETPSLVGSIDDLSDVDTTTAAPTNGQVLEWNGTNWVPATVSGGGGATSLDDLTDVDTSTVAPTDGQVLTWVDANSQWEPATATSGSIQTASDFELHPGVFPYWATKEFSSTPSAGEWFANGSSVMRANPVDSNGTDWTIEMTALGTSGTFWYSTDAVNWTQTTNAGGFDSLPSWFQFNLSPFDANSHTGGLYISFTDPASTPGAPLQDGDILQWVAADSAFKPASPVTSIDDLTDVDTSTAAPTDGQVLTWVDANSQWEPTDAAGGGISTPAVGRYYDFPTKDADSTPGTAGSWSDRTNQIGLNKTDANGVLLNGPKMLSLKTGDKIWLNLDDAGWVEKTLTADVSYSSSGGGFYMLAFGESVTSYTTVQFAVESPVLQDGMMLEYVAANTQWEHTYGGRPKSRFAVFEWDSGSATPTPSAGIFAFFSGGTYAINQTDFRGVFHGDRLLASPTSFDVKVYVGGVLVYDGTITNLGNVNSNRATFSFGSSAWVANLVDGELVEFYADVFNGGEYYATRGDVKVHDGVDFEARALKTYDLADVNGAPANNNEVLKYNSANGGYEPGLPAISDNADYTPDRALLGSYTYTATTTSSPPAGEARDYIGSNWAVNVVDSLGVNHQTALYAQTATTNVDVYVGGVFQVSTTLSNWSNKNSNRCTFLIGDDSWKAGLTGGELIEFYGEPFTLTDVATTNGQVLTWNSTLSAYQPTTPAVTDAASVRTLLGIGEYADDAAAGTGGVASGAMYYNTTSSDYRLKT